MINETDVPGYSGFAKIEPLDKGWSPDKKYYIETADGKRLLLRVADIDRYEDKKTAYGMYQRATVLGIPMSMPLGFGVCGNGKSVYTLLTWLDGEDAEEVLPRLCEKERYALGEKAGDLLRTLHTLPAPEDAEPWGERFRRKIQGRVDFYDSFPSSGGVARSAGVVIPIRCANGDRIIRFLRDNQDLPDSRPQAFRHGDFCVSNLIVTPDNQVGVIDFNAFNSDHGDPWFELCAADWIIEPDTHYYSGLIDGYFGGAAHVPEEFFVMLRYYFAYDALAALCDTSEGVQGGPEDGRRHAEKVLRWFGDMGEVVPVWYVKNRSSHLPNPEPSRVQNLLYRRV